LLLKERVNLLLEVRDERALLGLVKLGGGVHGCPNLRCHLASGSNFLLYPIESSFRDTVILSKWINFSFGIFAFRGLTLFFVLILVKETRRQTY